MKRCASTLLVVLLISACGQAALAPTPVPPTAGQPTSTPVRPTATSPAPSAAPAQAPTVTPVPPTAPPKPSPSAQPAGAASTWSRTYGGARNTVSGDLVVADDGGLYLVGTTNLEFEPGLRGDVYLLRIGAAGEVLWERTYGGEGYDAGESIAEDAGGNLWIAGSTASFGAQGIDVYLLKLDPQGDELWSGTYGGSLDERVGAIGLAPDGGILLGGNLVDPGDRIADPGAPGYGGYEGRSNPYLLKLDGDGRELWSRVYESEDNVLAAGGALTPDGGMLLLATLTRFPDPDDDIQLLRLDGEGNVLWSRTWDEGSAAASALVEASDGNYLIAGTYTPPAATQPAEQDLLFLKVDPDGEEIWRSILGDPGLIDEGPRLARTSDGGYIAVGERSRDLQSWQTVQYLVKLDAYGELLWERAQPSSHTMVSRVVQHPAGGFLIAGGAFRDPVFNLLLVRAGPQGIAGEPASAPDRSTPAGLIEAALQELAEQGLFSGAVLIARDGEILLRQAYGWADRARDLPNQVDTKFNLGSMDKMFTAVAILQLAEQGRLALEDRIADLLPGYPNQEVAEAVTVHQLLTHTGGLGDYFESERFEQARDQLRSVQDYLSLFVDAPLELAPGEQFRYSNSGYVVLGLIVEELAGQSYYDHVRASIFEPTGMASTGAYELDAAVPNLARGYTRFDAEYNELKDARENSFLLPQRGGPAGGGYSTVDDLLRFGNALLGHRLLSPESTGLLLEAKVRMGEHAQYAYGFMDRGTEGAPIVGHGGGAPGICSMLNMYLDLGYTTVVLTNGDEDCLAAEEIIRAALLP